MSLLAEWAAGRAKVAVCTLRDMQQALGPADYADWVWKQRAAEHLAHERSRREDECWVKIQPAQRAALRLVGQRCP